jgi:HEPN domain-containing protein
MTRMTREWLRKADADLRSARRLLGIKPADHDIVCFHCQQAFEKFVKGLLNERGIPFPKTHVLEDLVDLLLPSDPNFRSLRANAVRLTRYAVEYRYPGVVANKQMAKTALAAAEQVRAEIRRRLGLRR